MELKPIGYNVRAVIPKKNKYLIALGNLVSFILETLAIFIVFMAALSI